MRLAIHKDDKIFDHCILWRNEWINYCEVNYVSYDVVNCHDHDTLDQLKEFMSLPRHVFRKLNPAFGKKSILINRKMNQYV